MFVAVVSFSSVTITLRQRKPRLLSVSN